MGDLWQAFTMGQQARAMTDAREERQRQVALIPQKHEAVKRFLGGDPSMLQVMDPQLFERMSQAEQQRTANDVALKTEGVKRLANAALVIEKNPNLAPQVKNSLSGFGYKPEDLGQLDMPESRQALIGQFAAQAGQPKPIDLEKKAAALLHYGPDVAAARNDPRFDEVMNKIQFGAPLARARAGATVINTGEASKIGKTAEAKIQSGIVSDTMTLAAIEELKSIPRPERFATYGGEFKKWIGNKGTKLLGENGLRAFVSAVGMDPDEAVAFLEDARQYKETLGEIFYPLKTLVTGVAAGEKELEKIQGDMINSSLDPISFKASLERLERVTRRNLAIKKRLLQKNIDLSDPEGLKLFNIEILRAQRKEREERRANRGSIAPGGRKIGEIVTNPATGEMRRWTGKEFVPIDG